MLKLMQTFRRGREKENIKFICNQEMRLDQFLIVFSLVLVSNALEVPRLANPIPKDVFENVMGKRLLNTCPVGYSLPVWEKDFITESFCRCPDGSYGITCTEGFGNPCTYSTIYHPADASLPPNYFIECSQMQPFLMKCAPNTQWNQEILTCDWMRGAYRTSTSRGRPGAPIESGYGSYLQQQQASAPSYDGGYDQLGSSNYASAGQQSYGTNEQDQMPLIQSTATSYGNNLDQTALTQSKSVYSSNAYAIPSLTQATQSSYGSNNGLDQSMLTQSQLSSSYGQDQSALTQSSYQPYGAALKIAPTPAPVPTPVQVPQPASTYGQDQMALTQSTATSYGNSLDQTALTQSRSSYSSNRYATPPSLTQATPPSYGTSGQDQLIDQSSSLSLPPPSIISQPQDQSQSYGALYGAGQINLASPEPIPAIIQSSSAPSYGANYGQQDISNSLMNSLASDQQSNIAVKASGGHQILVQSFDAPQPPVSVQAPTPMPAPIPAPIPVQAPMPVPQPTIDVEVDLKHPDKFISFFNKVIEPMLQAKTFTNTQQQQLQQTITSTAPLEPPIQILTPTVNTQQVSSTQQQFRIDIPFAKSSSSSDPNCRIPNGATVSINFSFF